MASSGITIQGLPELLDRLEDMDDALKTGIDIEMDISARTIANDAKLVAPIDDGNLKNKIYANTTKQFEKVVTVNADYAAYVEFGTGRFAAKYVPGLPPDVAAYAKTFYVNGKGKKKEHPFLIPAALKEFPALLIRIKALLEP